MAVRVDNFTFPGVTRYLWRTWMDGTTWELKRGVDFTISGDSFRSAAYQWSKRNGYKVTVSVSADKTTVHLLRI